MACGPAGPAAAANEAPAAGLLLLSLRDGHRVASIALGSDPLAVALSPDGGVAYVSDNAPGLVYAVDLAARRVLWRTAVGGRPGPLLAEAGSVWVSLHAAGALADLDAADGRVLETRPACPGPGELAGWQGEVWTACSSGGAVSTGGRKLAGPAGFALAAAAGALWAADYAGGELDRLDGAGAARLPAGLHPFWLAAAGDGSLLVAAEGAAEDRDAGGVFRLRAGRALDRLAAARDPDQALEAGGGVYVAAHGDRSVLVLEPGGRTRRWAGGSAPVALAADPDLGLLVVVTDARE